MLIYDCGLVCSSCISSRPSNSFGDTFGPALSPLFLPLRTENLFPLTSSLSPSAASLSPSPSFPDRHLACFHNRFTTRGRPTETSSAALTKLMKSTSPSSHWFRFGGGLPYVKLLEGH